MPFSDRYVSDPFSVWEALREDGPVHRVLTPDGPPAWLVTRYDDVRAAFLDPRLSLDRRHARGGDYKGFALPAVFDSHLLATDPPDHTRLRRLVSPALTAQHAHAARHAIQTMVDELLTAAAEQGEVDLIAVLAGPLPMLSVCDFLRVEERDRAAFARWATDLLAAGTDRPLARARDSLGEIATIVADLIDSKRARPGSDLLSALVATHDVGDQLSTNELTAMVFYLLVVWYEISVDFLGNSVLALLQRPDTLAAIARNPRLLRPAIEELLRFEPPQTVASPRYATVEMAIGGVRVPAGDTVLLSLASANRDPRRFSRPRDLDVGRGDNVHLAFGLGIHTCLGAPLTRLQAQIALGTLLHRFPRITLVGAVDDLRWRHGLRHRGPRELPVRLGGP